MNKGSSGLCCVVLLCIIAWFAAAVGQSEANFNWLTIGSD